MIDDGSGGPSTWMTDRMVSDRCLRMWRGSQWRRLHEFSSKEPRARAWSLQRIAQLHRVADEDSRVAELFARLARGHSPRARIGMVVPGQDPADFEIVEEVDDAFLAEDVELDFDEPRVPAAAAAPPSAPVPLPAAFVAARDAGEYVEAGRLLLDAVHALPAGASLALMAVEFRELAAEVARAGGFRVVMELCAVLPPRVTAPAVRDLADKLQVGTQLHGPVMKLENAERANAGRAAVRQAETELLDAARALPRDP